MLLMFSIYLYIFILLNTQRIIKEYDKYNIINLNEA